jgi:hypothetical protein
MEARHGIACRCLNGTPNAKGKPSNSVVITCVGFPGISHD